ncbi:hypothetical protein A3Q56_08791, partial [Intoshia linei]
YFNVKDELWIKEELLMRGLNLIVLPKQLFDKCFSLSNVFHLGRTKCKQMMRSFFWFPEMNRYIDDKIDNCIECALSDKTFKFNKTRLSLIEYPESQ